MDTASYHSGSTGLQDPLEQPASSLSHPFATDHLTMNTTTNDRRKRSSEHITTGRSFKRLRLDQTHVSVPSLRRSHSNNSGNHPFDYEAQSIGTLSVGTMGGDLESNDDEVDEDDETEEVMSSQSSWVASLPGGLNRRMAMGDVDGKMPAAAAAGRIGSGPNYEAAVNDDDAATCAEMTTAAVAPRRKTRRRCRKKEVLCDNGSSSPPLLNGEQRKRRAIGFAFETTAAITARRNNNPLSSARKNDLAVQEIELDRNAMFLPKPPPSANAALFANDSNANNKGNPLQHSDSMPPPVECIPDPLLVAAQHAAVGGNNNNNDIYEDPNNSDNAGIFVGDCYSSVTEEETSLAEDEASLSAVSLGGNTIASGTVSSSKEQQASRYAEWMRCNSQEGVELKAAPPPPGFFSGHLQQQQQQQQQQHTVNNAMQQQDKAMDNHYNLNSFLGNLHRERQHRQSITMQSTTATMNSSPHRRGSSYQSMGSMGLHSNVSGNSHQSCPTTMNNFRDSMDMEVDMDDDNEGCMMTMNTNTTSLNQSNSQSTRGSNSEKGHIPKWKRRVKLPSHSSLY